MTHKENWLGTSWEKKLLCFSDSTICQKGNMVMVARVKILEAPLPPWGKVFEDKAAILEGTA